MLVNTNKKVLEGDNGQKLKPNQLPNIIAYQFSNINAKNLPPSNRCPQPQLLEEYILFLSHFLL